MGFQSGCPGMTAATSPRTVTTLARRATRHDMGGAHMTRGIIVILAGLLLLCEMVFSVSTALAQAPGGAFQQLSAGNQKAARALHEAQRPDLRPASRLTLDEIAARKQNGQGWTRIFDGMKSQGL